MKFEFFKKFDYVLIASVFILCLFGVSFIYSSGVNSDGILVSKEYFKQIIWFAVGFLLMICITFFDYRRIKRYVGYLFITSVCVLIYTKLFGRYVNGAKSWIGIGGLGIQPSEISKIIYILYLAYYLEVSKKEKPVLRCIKAISIMAVPVLLILAQPDLGTATVFFPIFLTMGFIAGIEKKYLGFILGCACCLIFFTILPIWQNEIARVNIPIINLLTNSFLNIILIAAFCFLTILFFIGYFVFKKKYYYWLCYSFLIFTIGLIGANAAGHVLKDYQIKRLIVFLNPDSDPRGAGWNIIQSKIAIGSGGLQGRGFLKGTQSHLRFLPEQSTDFIFSIIAEESGFIGSIIVFFCFFLILSRCIYIMKETNNTFGCHIVAGVFGMFFYHFMLNVGMVMGIMPIAGIPLPFLSYGGSALLTNMITMGFLMSIHSRRLEYREDVL